MGMWWIVAVAILAHTASAAVREYAWEETLDQNLD
ncbi:unnamed protein product [Brassica napus]|uniref:(rape) hypothetical protein n=1 Tax=Brassica napus TaxID=3708 RepID=A0A816JNQ6_BRANA|nr:unnamed protein product [Brassica napus]